MPFVKLSYRYECSACGVEYTDTFSMDTNPLSPLRLPSPPPEWKRVRDLYFCGNHKVVIAVDPGTTREQIFQC